VFVLAKIALVQFVIVMEIARKIIALVSIVNAKIAKQAIALVLKNL